jgi:hypothetical protein
MRSSLKPVLRTLALLGAGAGLATASAAHEDEGGEVASIRCSTEVRDSVESPSRYTAHHEELGGGGDCS